jgi:hypothetical protein
MLSVLRADSCKTQAQMLPAMREVLSSEARSIAAGVQTGNLPALQAETIPSVAADFSGIAASVDSLKPLVQNAAITIDNLYFLEASTVSAGATRTDFYCGSPVVALNFNDLPPGAYALVVLHATGVPQPQQISLILSLTPAQKWMLAGLFSKPMTEAGHDGLWYWVSAREYAHKNMNWNAWFYYRIAADTLQPVDFLVSPNLDKLRHEEDLVHPSNLPEAAPLALATRDSVFAVNAIDTTTVFGALDLEIHYAPDAAQTAQLRNPVTARQQVTTAMQALLTLHPELRDAFHGIWVRADQGASSLYSLELPMDQIALLKPQMETTSIPAPQ